LGYEVIPINSELIYPFPKGSPDPEQPSKVQELGEKVKELGADVGIAYDGDADRVGIVNEKGCKIESTGSIPGKKGFRRTSRRRNCV
jgi:phosphomannomutase/phosphoglucomutase